jgi:hypothetical protein
MAACRFTISTTNPNNAIGGGGCACSPLANPDTSGPYAVFNATETDNNMSPHVVVCIGCAAGIVAATHDETNILSLGEDDEANEDELSL